MPRTAEMKPSRRVLVIDDEDAIRSLMAEMIGNWGYEVTTDSKIESTYIANLGRDDIVFIDMMMPGADGIQVLASLARHKVKSAIVLMSGTHVEVLAAAERIARQQGLKVAGTLSKPFKSHELRRLLDAAPELRHECELRRRSPEINVEDVVAALERREFDAHLQPIVSLSNGKAVAFEALARWRGDRFNAVGPERFVKVAAHNGILPRLTQQIAERALDHAAALRKRGLRARVSINIGADDLMDASLPEKLAEAVALRGLPAHSLIVELTESSATSNETRMLEVLARLRLKGIDLAIDDFGTAYASLDRLSVCPFSILKIDRRFVRDIATNVNARAIVQSSVRLAKRMNLTTVAEGIENEAQLRILKSLGCGWGQGYLFAPAMDWAAALAWAEGRESTAA
jgi:EAL domain-containing protein (putative c-di-GMP-specific phosphodiesterase class I)/ActR/RegA family two-component response regulator